MTVARTCTCVCVCVCTRVCVCVCVCKHPCLRKPIVIRISELEQKDWKDFDIKENDRRAQQVPLKPVKGQSIQRACIQLPRSYLVGLCMVETKTIEKPTERYVDWWTNRATDIQTDRQTTWWRY